MYSSRKLIRYQASAGIVKKKADEYGCHPLRYKADRA